MCGIFACISCSEANKKILKELEENEWMSQLMRRRGPDQCAKSRIAVTDQLNNEWLIFLMSTVLQLRGEFLCDQPVYGRNGNVFQWNGQIFGGIDIDESDSDTDVLMKQLDNCCSDQQLLNVFSQIDGPWSFTYWQNREKRFWFGRDILGRRSLCWNINRRDEFLMISSISYSLHIDDGEPLIWEEIPADGVYCFDFSNSSSLDLTSCLKHFSWNRRISGLRSEKFAHSSGLTLTSPITVALNRTLPLHQYLEQQIPRSVIDNFINILRNSVRKRCLNQQHLCKKCFARSLENIDFDKPIEQSSSDSEGDILGPPIIHSQVSDSECTHASTAILFSGGLDSTIIALLTDECIASHLPIDLLNVAFDSNAPDRETGLSAWNELKNLRPNRRWNFVSIYISREELQTMREKHIKHLVKPSHTVLDDSIGCAIWFAANGKGLLLEDCEVTSVYETPARVVLLGMGADEQLAGYARHRHVFQKSGWSGLLDEISLEIDRLSSRNLGRDDRVVSDHGREPRYPFLDEQVINFLNDIPIWQKCDLNLNRSTGEKLLLRKVANRLGLLQTSQHLKRAIQFGSRIAKIEDNREKGNDFCLRLANH